MQQKFKVGDIVQHKDGDIGEVLECLEDEMYIIDYDRDGTKYSHQDYNELIRKEGKEDKDEEQKAVALLLSLGYTLSKKND